ncbi:hypothetical protein KEM54_001569 [Ascosphaera aggregata]|nr:hypothetical protein KEM54_001569 [Ascosphaera aggregata]
MTWLRLSVYVWSLMCDLNGLDGVGGSIHESPIPVGYEDSYSTAQAFDSARLGRFLNKMF